MTNGPSHGTYVKTVDKEVHETQESDVEALVFFFCQTFENGLRLFVNAWVIIIFHPIVDVCKCTLKVTLERNAFRADAIGASEINDRIPWIRRNVGDGRDLLKSMIPVAVTIGIFAAEPPDKIAIKKVKSEKRRSHEQATMLIQDGRWIGRGTWETQCADRG